MTRVLIFAALLSFCSCHALGLGPSTIKRPRAQATIDLEVFRHGTAKDLRGQIEALRQSGSLGVRDEDDWTPLMNAAGFNPHPEVIVELLLAGADPRALSYHGESTLDLAMEDECFIGTATITELSEAMAE
jgi:hypothetical protein